METEQPNREEVEALLEQEEMELEDTELDSLGTDDTEEVTETSNPIVLNDVGEESFKEIIELKTPLLELKMGSNKFDVNQISSIAIELIKNLPSKCFHNGNSIKKRKYIG